MSDPTRIRAQVTGDKATVRVLMAHEMESGQRKDAAGKTIPAWHIQEMTATLNGQPVLRVQMALRCPRTLTCNSRCAAPSPVTAWASPGSTTGASAAATRPSSPDYSARLSAQMFCAQLSA